VTQGRMKATDLLFSTEAMMEVLSEESFFQGMLRFEVSLSQALESAGLIPAGSSDAVARTTLGSLNLSGLAEKAALAGNVCIPFVKALTASVAAIDGEAAAYVHWGATSQDVIDTALLLQWRTALDLIEVDIRRLCAQLAVETRKYKDMVMPGRTWLQQGPPLTLGYKFATWLDALLRHLERIGQMRKRVFVLQFGGAVGTLAPYKDQGIALAQDLAARLGLCVAKIPWHTQRDRVGELAGDLALLVGTLGKVGRDVGLLMQTEVGEFLEGASEGRGSSSTMPHKRNPVSSAVLLQSAIRVPALASTIYTAMVQEHERGLGGWHAEWETMSEIFRLTAGAVKTALTIVEEGVAVPAAMRMNLERMKGVAMAEAISFALAERIGKSEAHRILERGSRRALDENISLVDGLKDEPELMQFFSEVELRRLTNPEHYLGSAGAFLDAVLAEYARSELWQS
jgi:3-carboxy-cis,cis-muconate cycloisomerase